MSTMFSMSSPDGFRLMMPAKIDELLRVFGNRKRLS